VLPPATEPDDTTAQAPETSRTTAETTDERLFPDPNAPRTVTVGTHVLGVIVGLLLGPIGAGVLLLGQARVLAVQVDAWDASVEVLGITLVTLGLLLHVVVLLLGLWTPAVPITAGALLTAAGALSLYAPGIARTQVLDLLTSDGWRLTVTQTVVAGTSGTLLVGGLLLLVAGLALAAARRQGVRLGAFRERNRA